jgi:hypothetical protein
MEAFCCCAGYVLAEPELGVHDNSQDLYLWFWPDHFAIDVKRLEIHPFDVSREVNNLGLFPLKGSTASFCPREGVVDNRLDPHTICFCGRPRDPSIVIIDEGNGTLFCADGSLYEIRVEKQE